MSLLSLKIIIFTVPFNLKQIWFLDFFLYDTNKHIWQFSTHLVVLYINNIIFLKIVQYVNSELADMPYMYGLSNGNALKAMWLYDDHFPNGNILDAQTFSNIYRRLCDSFNSDQHLKRGQFTIKTPEVEVEVLNLNEVDPALSMWKKLEKIEYLTYCCLENAMTSYCISITSNRFKFCYNTTFHYR